MNIKVVEEKDIPENVLCVFGEKVPRGIKYILGYRKGDFIKVHFSQRTHTLENIISYQFVLNLNNKKIKK